MKNNKIQITQTLRHRDLCEFISYFGGVSKKKSFLQRYMFNQAGPGYPRSLAQLLNESASGPAVCRVGSRVSTANTLSGLLLCKVKWKQRRHWVKIRILFLLSGIKWADWSRKPGALHKSAFHERPEPRRDHCGRSLHSCCFLCFSHSCCFRASGVIEKKQEEHHRLLPKVPP